ncbi:MAG: hypothetical protein LBD13_02035 [Spirochaetaceae bacterium]|jgi:hypothetical protein|nr:hypothetical protein [Spirochaetaceae bacterium]
MKKFWAAAGLLVMLGGTGFFLGWVQLTVPTGSYGVMRSKTHGLDGEIIQAGAFRWAWYKLIPTNVEILIFTPHRIERPIKTQDTLPSGSEYAGFAGFAIDFSYDLTAALSFTLKPESLISLIEKENILNQAGLDEFEAKLADRLEAFTLQRLKIYMEDEKRIQEIIDSGTIGRLHQDISGAFPLVKDVSCFIHTTRFPDFSLYHKFKALYEEYVAKMREHIQRENILRPETRVASYIRLDELEKYGELLTKYPILLQYLALEKGAPAKEAP